jgi:putative ABC transport system permease protein
MRFARAARLSLRALAAQRLRSALALSSVAIGVAGVLLTSAVGAGASAELRDGVGATRDLIVVRPAQVKRLVGRGSVRGAVTTLRPEDAEAIAALPAAAAVAASIDGSARLEAGSGGSVPAGVLGTDPSYAAIRGLRLRHGRFLDARDDEASARVVVLGARVARTLFGALDPVGREVRLRGLPFEVIGVLAPDGMKADGSDQDGTVFVPLRTALRRVYNRTWLSAVFVSVDEGSAATAEQSIRALLRERHRLVAADDDDFAVQDQARLVALQREAIGSLTLVSSGLAAVALLVGGAGILALMLLSVKERTAEIGLRMAVGARPRDVLLQFLGEATALALGGWATGAALAVAGGLAIAAGTAWRLAFPTGAAAVSLLMALTVGLGFGALPARRAARLPPITALRGAS